MDAVDEAIFKGVDFMSKSPLSPFTALFLFVFRTPMPLIIYLTCLKIIKFKPDNLLASLFGAMTAAGIILNTYIFLVVPLTIQYLINSPPSTDEGAISFLSFADLFLNLNLNLVTPIIVPLFEITRLFLIYSLLFRSKIIKSLYLYAVGLLILGYEILCFTGAFFEVFDFWIFDYSPESYNYFASFASSSFIFFLFSFLFFKNIKKNFTSD